MPKTKPTSDDFGKAMINRIYWDNLRAILERNLDDRQGRPLCVSAAEETFINLGTENGAPENGFAATVSTKAPELKAMFLFDFIRLCEERSMAPDQARDSARQTDALSKALAALRADMVGLRDNRKQLQNAIVKDDSLDKIDEEAARLLWEVNELEIESAKGIVKQDYRRMLATKKQRLSVLSEAKDYLLLSVLNTDAGKAIKNIDATLRLLCAEFISLGYDLYAVLQKVEDAQSERKAYMSSPERRKDLLDLLSLLQSLAEQDTKTEPLPGAGRPPETPVTPEQAIEIMDSILEGDSTLFAGHKGRAACEPSLVLVPASGPGQLSKKENAIFLPLLPEVDAESALIALAARYRLDCDAHRQDFINYRQAAGLAPEMNPELFADRFVKDYLQWHKTDMKGFHSLPRLVREWFVRELQPQK